MISNLMRNMYGNKMILVCNVLEVINFCWKCYSTISFIEIFFDLSPTLAFSIP